MPKIQDLEGELHIIACIYCVHKLDALVKKVVEALTLFSKVMQLVTDFIQEYQLEDVGPFENPINRLATMEYKVSQIRNNL